MPSNLLRDVRARIPIRGIPWRLLAKLAIAGVALVAVGACARTVRTFAAPASPVTGISNMGYQSLLARYVSVDGQVDYARWQRSKADVQALDDYLSTLTHATPDTRGDLFTAPSERLSYWINLYNALVLREILRRWPIGSVTDVRVNSTSFLSTGKGFFYDLEFVVGGHKMNLYDIENKILRAQFKDARIHFAINCGSSSCPLLRRDAFDPAQLETQLEQASKTFVNDGVNVVVDEGKRTVSLSKIFAWYSEDFVAFARQRSMAPGAGLLDFVALYADAALLDQITKAKTQKYDIRFLDYDWRLNQRAATGDNPSGATAPDASPSLPAARQEPVLGVKFALAEGHGQWSPSTSSGKVVLLDFWATYCIPCKASFPKLQALQDKYSERGLVVVGISEDDDPVSVVPSFVAATGVRFLIGVDPNQSAAADPLRIRALPTELLIDRRGRVRKRYDGLKEGDLDEIELEIVRLLDER